MSQGNVPCHAPVFRGQEGSEKVGTTSHGVPLRPTSHNNQNGGEVMKVPTMWLMSLALLALVVGVGSFVPSSAAVLIGSNAIMAHASTNAT